MKPIQAWYNTTIYANNETSVDKEECYILKFISLHEETITYAVFVTSDGTIKTDNITQFTIIDPSFFFKAPFPKAIQTSHATPA